MPGGVTAEAQPQGTDNQGERTMGGEMGGPEGERVIRWLEESPTVFESVRRMLHEYDRVTELMGAAQTEREQLQQKCEALRQEVRQLQTEIAHLRKDRAESAQWVVAMMREAASRFPIEPPRA